MRLLFCLSIEQDEIRSSDKNTILKAESLWRKIHLFLTFESHLDFDYELVGKFGGQDRDIFPILQRLYGLRDLAGIIDLLLGTGLMSAS